MQLQGQWQRRCSHQLGQLLLLEERPKKLRGECIPYYFIIAVVLGLMQMLVVLCSA